ncbi:MAG: hypothetical protein ACE366_13555 [Bradymonadia bacterium]
MRTPLTRRLSRPLALAFTTATTLWCAGCASGDAQIAPVAPEIPSEGTLEVPTDRGAAAAAHTAGKADGECGDFPSWALEHLDDTRCRKAQPSSNDRSWMCPTTHTSEKASRLDTGAEVVYRSEGAFVEVDDTALVDLVPPHIRMTLILIRRIDGVPHFRYLSNGAHDEARETWSSSKFLAVANAGAHMREASQGVVGLDSVVKLDSGEALPLGDLVTVIHSYDQRRFTSNGLARWFHDIGGRDRANALVHAGWLDRPASETFGGNYGAPAPALPLRFDGSAGALTLEADDTTGPDNTLSTFTLAEALKRLVLHRELAGSRMPHLTWADVQVLLYGAPQSSAYGQDAPQGMQGDTAIYVQQALDLPSLEARSQGQWRIFSKLGAGPSRGGEIVHNAYGCLPVLDEAGRPVADQGKEFVIATHMSAGGDMKAADQQLARLYSALIERVLDGRLK